ncbi:CCA tRNA nucleotidyltransferase [Bacillus mojavensis]|uniref:CCA tRNA nucleotidyltransferase n=1 Tax=Bacillus mojavensis TaxID=72360 RepID=UPI000289C00B|nr:CCA tRNA nucleotidyltransferase [Bacillus mojavensis]MDR4226121.1 CCA tRNA nucleotidyltransferase [Bacillus mojavensis]MEC1754212.1 CCA tRNA nucleotidyltransferase [Bacillus mojavensis]MEC3588802.1 CCA tRNA nucleotidyltransferase [Bacillus mojavensis]MEC5244788.1 CCA tRNA nucleotidyltransferase [Bacillus mojavensis]MED0748520.1 CCA tRNA nucleotidyltransferase [Bacillus mojavensis]
MKQDFIKALPVLRTLIEAGHQAYFVGGAVRDSYMKRTIGDVDIATDAAPDQVERLFKRTVDVGKEHGTIIVLWEDDTYEVTTFRTESDYEDYRRPSEVHFITSLEEDLKRRDLTINAMAMTADGQVLDYFGGKKDIDQQLIRTVGKPEDRFQEDALRMLRAVRFMSQLGFTLSKETEEAIIKEKTLLSHVSVERKTIEFEKLLLGKASREAIQMLVHTGLYKELPGFYHKRENLLTASEFPFSFLTSREELWAALLIDLQIELKDAMLFLKAWKLPGKVMKEAAHIADTFGQSLDAMSMYKAGEKALLSAVKISMLRQTKQLNGERLKEVREAYQSLPIKSLKDLAITGRDLLALRNQPAGKWVSEELQRIEQAVVTGKLSNQKKHIEEWLKTCDQP